MWEIHPDEHYGKWTTMRKALALIDRIKSVDAGYVDVNILSSMLSKRGNAKRQRLRKLQGIIMCHTINCIISTSHGNFRLSRQLKKQNS